MTRPTLLGCALCAGLAAANAARVSALVVAALASCVALASPRAPLVALACALALGGWWWGSERLRAIDHSVLAPRIGTAERALVDVDEPPRVGRFGARMRATVLRWGALRVGEPVMLELGGARPPPQGARLRVLGTLRAPSEVERGWLRLHGVHVVLHASSWRRVGARGSLADRLHGWLARGAAPGLGGERRAVVEGVVLGEDQGLTDSLKARFRASGLYHLLAVSGGNVAVVSVGTAWLVLAAGLSRLVAETCALAAIVGYVLAVGPQPSVVRAGIGGALACLAWLSGRARDRVHALVVAAAALLAWSPYTLQDPGFQLSFAAVASIFWLAPRIAHRLEGYPLPRRAREAAALSAACGLATAPISWVHFHQVPLLTVPANLAAAAVVGPMLALALLAAVLSPLGPALAQLNGLLAAYLAGCARFFGGLPGAQVRSPAGAAALASVALLAAAYAWRGGERAEAGLPADGL